MRQGMLLRILCWLGGCVLSGAVPAFSAISSSRVHEGVVHAAWFSTRPCTGGTNAVHIRIEPNVSKRIQVGFFESSASAIGQQWRTAGWMAAFVSTTLLGQDLHNQRISYTIQGLIDGPSAGALTTCGLLALMRGEAIPEHASMTGIVNPDGTVGPVGGIPLKIRGAKEAGKTRFAVPLGQRRDRNLCTNQEEDVVALGRSLGIEVVEVGDVREAYTFLTGISWPAKAPRAVTLTIPDDIRIAFRQLFTHWEGRYETARRVVQSAQPRELPEETAQYWRHAVKLVAAARDELKAGHEPAAFNRLWLAVLHAEFVARSVMGMRSVLSRGIPALQERTRDEIAQVRRYIASHIKTFQGLSVSTAVDAGAIAFMGANVAVALAFLDQADASLSRSFELSRSSNPRDHIEAAVSSFQALGQVSVSGPLLDAAVAMKGWLGRGGPPLPHDLGTLEAAIELYSATARSNLEYVDAIHTAQLAEEEKIDIESARRDLRRSDPHYLSARGALEQTGKLRDYFGQGEAFVFAVLGARMRTVSDSSVLIAKYYSLSARLDEQGRVSAFGNEPALQRMTEMAEQEALRTLGEADAVTAGASTPMLATLLDAARRNRDVSVSADDRLMALTLFWDATLNARIMSQLAPGR